MSSPRKLKVLPGVLAGLLTLALQLISAPLLLLWLGGLDELSRTLEMAGPAIHRVILISVLSTAALTVLLFLLASGRKVPLVAPMAVALVPWLAGLAVALLGTVSMNAAVGNAAPDYRLIILATGLAEVLSARLLGAWSSATLLLGVAGGLFLAGVWRLGPRQEPEDTPASERMLEAGVALALAIVCGLSASESKGLSGVLAALSTVNPADWNVLLIAGAQELRGTVVMRMGAIGVLALCTAALGVQQVVRRPGGAVALVSLVLLLLVGGATLWVDGRPLAQADAAMDLIKQLSPQAPALATVRHLPFGGDREPAIADIVATPRGLSALEGAEVPWSAGDEALAGFLRQVIAPPPAPKEDKPSIVSRLFAAEARRHITLALDARVPVSELRRLIDLCSQAGLIRLSLLGSSGPASSASEQPAAAGPGHPFLMRIAATWESTPALAQVFLPSAIGSEEISLSNVWGGEVGAERQVSLSEVLLEGQGETRVLELAAPDEPPSELVSGAPVLYLIVKEQAALEDVAHAIRKARAQGFQVVLATRPPQGPD